MNKLILAACLIVLAGAASAQLGLGLGGIGLGGVGLGGVGLGGVGLGGLGWGSNLGYGLITGTKLPNLGWGNIGSAVNNINLNGYNLRTSEVGPRGGRIHVQSQIAPIHGGIGIIG